MIPAMRVAAYTLLMTVAAVSGCKSCNGTSTSNSATTSPSPGAVVRRQGAILGGDDPAASGFKTVARVELFGDTPTLAWSPDSRHVAVSAAYQNPESVAGYGYGGYGYGYGSTNNSSDLVLDRLGIHVVRAADGKVVAEHIMENAFHPVWTSNDSLAWIGDADGSTSNGLVTARLNEESKTQLFDYTLYNLQSAGDGKLLFYRTGPDAGWYRYTPGTGTKPNPPEKVAEPDRKKVAPGPAWVPPEELAQSQCQQATGRLRVARDPERVALYVDDTKASEVNPERPFTYSHWACASNDPYCGPLPGCISPDGKQLAFVTQNPTGFWLNVVPLHVETIASLARPTATRPAPGVARTVELSSDSRGDERSTLVNIVLHGSTPSLAWSPDSKRLVTNSTSPDDGGASRPASGQDGIYIVNVASATVEQIYFNPGYHPVWVGNDRVAWVTSSFDVSDQQSGLYTVDLSREPVIARRVMKSSAVYTSVPVDDERLLVWRYGWEVDEEEGEDGWHYVTPSTRAVEKASDVHASSNWEPPKKYRDRQCLQSVGGISVRTTPDQIALVNNHKSLVVSTAPFRYRHWLCEDPKENDGKYCGPVRACLSPDGSKLAYVAATDSGTGSFGIKVVKVPR